MLLLLLNSPASPFGNLTMRAGLGELLGLSQADYQVSERLDLRMVREQVAPLVDSARSLPRRRQGSNPPGIVAQFLRWLFG